MTAPSESIWTHCVAVGAWAEKRGGGWRCNQDGLFLASYTCFQATISRLQIWPQEEMTNDPHGVNSQEHHRDAAFWLVWHTVRNQRNPVKNHDATDYFHQIDFLFRHSYRNLNQPDWEMQFILGCLMTTWWLHDDCMMTACWLPFDCLLTAC